MSLNPGARLGSYEILSALGAGGMGEVYRARDTRLKRDVALKLLPDHFATDADRLSRFQREAEALAALNHPNIAAIYGLEEAGDVHALVLELVDGDTLADRIADAKGPGLPLDQSLAIALQLTAALEAAHAKGIIHRDLKPANIKVTSSGQAKVLDFGLAKVFATTPDAIDVSNSPTIVGTLSGSAGVILGTAAYMSPEQARGKPVDARTDIWAFGCVLFEMLTGRAAFSGETITDILGAIVKSEPDWSALPAKTPSPIRRLLKRCLAKDPNERLHSIADARLDIADAGAEPVAIPQAPAASAKRERLPWAIAVLALVATLVLAIVYFRTPRALVANAPQLRLEVSTPPTSDPLSFALSPDGRRLVFAASDGGTARLWIRSLDTLAQRPLIGTEGGGFPFWSPNSRSIGFFSGGKLKRIDVDGGSPTELANASVGRGGTWNGEGVILFGRSQGAGLFRVLESGGPVTAATQLAPRQTSHRFPQFLPDGRRFLYFVQAAGDIQGVYIGSLDSRDTKRLVASDVTGLYLPSGYLLYVRQGALVAQKLDVEASATSRDSIHVADIVGADTTLGVGSFSVSSTGLIAHRAGGPGRRQLTWLDRTGRVVGTVGGPQEYGQNYVDLTPDGTRVVFDQAVDGNRDVWLSDVARGVPTRLTSAAAIDSAPIWSADGNSIIFRSGRNGPYDLFQKSLTGDDAELPLLQSAQNKIPNDCSIDGQFLLYAVQAETSDLWVMPLSGDRKPFAYLTTAFDETQGQFSPDGHWVAYNSNETGPLEVYVRPFRRPGSVQRISTGGGASPRWRPDGRELFYLTPDAKVMAVPFGSDGSPGQAVALFQTRVGTGPWSSTVGNLVPQYDVAANGRFLFNVTTEEAVSPINIIVNWKPQ